MVDIEVLKLQQQDRSNLKPSEIVEEISKKYNLYNILDSKKRVRRQPAKEVDIALPSYNINNSKSLVFLVDKRIEEFERKKNNSVY